MKNKNPNVKSESIKWLIRCLKMGKSIPQREQIKILSEGLLKVNINFQNIKLYNIKLLIIDNIVKIINEKTRH